MHLEKIKKIVWVWTIGLLGKLLFLLLMLTRRVEVTGYRKKKLAHKGRGLIIICNHPDLWTPFLLPFLFAPLECLFSLEAIPYSLVDRKNYYDKKWFRWLLFHLFSMPIERRKPRKEAETIEKVLRPALKEGKILILFPEGTRTFGGIKLRGGKYSPYGKIARFPPGLSKLFYDTDCFVLFVWTRGGDGVIPNEADFSRTISKIPRIWHKTKIKVGDPLEIRHIPEKEIIDWLEDALLDTAEQGGQR